MKSVEAHAITCDGGVHTSLRVYLDLLLSIGKNELLKSGKIVVRRVDMGAFVARNARVEAGGVAIADRVIADGGMLAAGIHWDGAIGHGGQWLCTKCCTGGAGGGVGGVGGGEDCTYLSGAFILNCGRATSRGL